MKKKKKKFECPEGFFLGDKVTKLRKKYSLTIGNLAEDIESTISVVWRYENKKNISPNLFIVAKTVDVFNKYGENMSVSDLIDPTKLIYGQA